MKLIVKFNAVLLCIMAVGLGLSFYIGQRWIDQMVRTETLGNAKIMMDAATAVRTYTSGHIRGLLENQMKYSFLPESVPSFAATETFNALREKYAEFSYKEAALNPTNPRDRVTDWEADIVQQFRGDKAKTEIVGERQTPAGLSLYLAKPVVIQSGDCLQCHGSADAAPQTLVEKYGSANGFGWQMGEVVGAQIVSVPADGHVDALRQARAVLIGLLAGLCVAIVVALNVMLRIWVIAPLSYVCEVADRASLDIEDAPSFDLQVCSEMTGLARAFERLRTSLHQALVMLESPSTRHAP
jgi:hypothetical protein